MENMEQVAKERLSELAEEAIGQVKQIQIQIDALRLAMEQLEHIAAQASDVVAPDRETEMAKAIMIKAYKDTAKAIRGGTFWIDARKDVMQTKAEIEATLLRNLRILDDQEGFTDYLRGDRTVYVEHVEAMLRACAGNLSQMYAPIDDAIDDHYKMASAGKLAQRGCE